MAFVVLLSTMSFTINMHYCGDTLVETAMFKQAKGCGMEMETPLKEDCSVIKKDCCNNQQITLDSQDELQIQLDEISFNQKVFITSYMYSYINLFEGLEHNVSIFEEYKPPLVTKELYKFDETYLI
jgi:hypothetical protein